MINSTGSPTSTLAPEPMVPPSRPEKAEQDTKQLAASLADIARETSEQSEDKPVVDREAAAKTVAKALAMDFPSNSALEIAVNDQDDGYIYRAVDRDTGEVLKQFPAEEVLSSLERLNRIHGLAVDGQV
jgi:flagellar protein FlaG